MIRKYLFSLGFALLGLGCLQQSTSTTPALKVSIDREVSLKDLEYGLNMQGLHISPFEYESRLPHNARFTVKHYRDGEVVDDGSSSLGTLNSLDAGKQRFVIFMERGDDRIEFRFSREGSSVGNLVSGVDTRNTASTHTVLEAQLKSGKPEAVFVFCMNKEGISMPGDMQEQPIEYFVNEYDEVIAVFLEIR